MDNPLAGYERVKMVGKGSSGTAVLYKRIEDSKLVVIKEINMIDLGIKEKNMALNEVKVLSLLNHPNIIRKPFITDPQLMEFNLLPIPSRSITFKEELIYNRRYTIYVVFTTNLSYYGSFERDGLLMIEMEYANNGTLAQMLSKQDYPFTESSILNVFTQIVSAINYMHQNKILHRDLKSANILLNKNGTIKVGDFGLSKMMNSRAQADTVLGTPYYLSPELCQGKEYNQKSDIWALGCILYEMATLRKPFQAPNLSALVKKITEEDYEKLPAEYTDGWNVLIANLLQKDPTLRPTAYQIQSFFLPNIVEEMHNRSFNAEMTIKSTDRSLIYLLTSFEKDISLQPVKLPPKKIADVAVSITHCIALTTDSYVYKWGSNILDNGTNTARGVVAPLKPMRIDALLGKTIKRIAAGNGFSVYVTDTGLTLTDGSGQIGCLGHGDRLDQIQAKVVEKLRNEQVIEVKAGVQHVIVLTIDGKIFTWGIGKFGCLGLGYEDDCDIPHLVRLPSSLIIFDIFCGPDCTAILTNTNKLYVCGSNASNKLSLNNSTFFSRNSVEMSSIFTEIQQMNDDVKSIAMGEYHSAILTTSGHLVTMGRNNEGQLGQGHCDKVRKPINSVHCGATYTIISTRDNIVYTWGTRFSQTIKRNSTAHENSAVFSQSVRSEEALMPVQTNLNTDEFGNEENAIFFNEIAAPFLSEIILQPRSILALYSSPDQIVRNEVVLLQNIRPVLNKILVVIDTTVPQPTKFSRLPKRILPF